MQSASLKSLNALGCLTEFDEIMQPLDLELLHSSSDDPGETSQPALPSGEDFT